MILKEKINRLIRIKGFGLISDTVILGLGNATQKVILLLLMPIYTSILTTSEYGTIDVIITFVELLVPIATLNIESTVFRFVIDDNSDRKNVLNYSLGIIWKGTLIVTILAICLHLLSINYYLEFIVAMFFTFALRNVVANYIRGIGKVRLFAIGGIVATVSLAISNIIILTVIGADIKGYFIAIILSNIINTVILIIFEKSVWTCFVESLSPKKIFALSGSNFKKNQDFLKYSIPLIPNTLSWWLNSASSRFILLFFWGTATAGLYSAAIKIPSIINLFATVFQQAWQYYATKERRNENKLIFYRKVYVYFCNSIILICSIAIQLSKFISSIILKNDFFIAWSYVPFLILSSAIATVSVFYGGLYTAEKRSKDLMTSTVAGSVVNIIICLALTYYLGITAVVIASIISNCVIMIIRIYTCSKQLKATFDQKNVIVSFILLLVQSFCISIDTSVSIWISLFIMLVIMKLNIVPIIRNIARYK
jgi:O-antigen/teichoic acid export membrane protein